MIRYKAGILQALKEKGYTSARLRKERIFGEATIQDFRTQRTIPNVTLNRLCTMLNCQIQDVIEFIPDNAEGGETPPENA